ncbi:MAG: leucyl/phenylalanyl-tRNA--protein transferase [Hahellaceae bacterium]|nr:leucyl/phenylalanyl-tRNA--protein transferase [Hahellaceae bacterium]MCP5212931.1 leucyl/phenylalanyl-tRNA--protein transferase [Hahellaceae bacterium]
MTKIAWLDDQLWFPDLSEALQDPDGLLAAGGDLSSERLALAYYSGIFPWYSDGQPILWWSPGTRCIIDQAHLHISASMRKLIRKERYQITRDRAFEQVIRSCAAPRSYADSTWITEDMIQAYTELHRRGIAHSFEVWDQQAGEKLVGGLYGVAIGSCFFGESMFSTAPNTSKLAFIHMVEQLTTWNFKLIDCQLENPHLMSMGAYGICKQRFLTILKSARVIPPSELAWRQV